MNSIEIVKVESGREYSIGKFLPNELQYMDRDYTFNYIPEELKGCVQGLQMAMLRTTRQRYFAPRQATRHIGQNIVLWGAEE